MLISDAKNLIRHYVEKIWNHGDLTAFQNFTTESFTYQIGGQPARDRLGMEQFLGMIRTAFPNWRVAIMEMIVENDRVAVRWQGEVTHEGFFYGLPPTGKHIHVSGINMYRVSGNKIDAEWEQTDTLGMLQQLGALPKV